MEFVLRIKEVRMKRIFTNLIIIASIVLGTGNYSLPQFQTADQSITGKEILKHARYLASYELKGRETFTEGQYEAARYIAKEFEKYGTKTLTKSQDYYQHFEMECVEVIPPSTFEMNGKTYSEREDFRVAAVGGGGIESEVVFIGYGISTKQYDSYADVDVKNKIVMVFQGKIYRKGPVWGLAPFHPMRLLYAINHGASGMIFVEGTSPKDHKWPIPSNWNLGLIKLIGPIAQKMGLGTWNDEVWEKWFNFPMVYVNVDVGNELLKDSEKTIQKLKDEIDRARKPHSFALEQKAKIQTKISHGPKETMNAIGMIEGSDSSLKEEFIVVGAHYDHLGTSADSGEVYYGADDNASGTAALLEIAQAFAKCKRKPKRSILFIAFTGEEVGALGSNHYINNPEVPLSKTVAMFNLDMVGRNNPNEIMILCVGKNKDLLTEINSKASEKVGIDLKELKKSYADSSDHSCFYRKGIPVVFYYDGGGDFAHKPADTWDKLSPLKMEKVARLCFLALSELANRE